MRPKILLLVSFLMVGVPTFNCQTGAGVTRGATGAKTEPCKFLSFADAGKILGQPVELVTNSWVFMTGKTRLDCAYRGVEKDAASGKDVNLFFSSEEMEKEPADQRAHEVFESAYRQINEPDIFVGKLSGVGDEAFLISNPPQFHFMMVRKGRFILRFKLNKAAKGTSLEALKAFARTMTGEILALDQGGRLSKDGVNRTRVAEKTGWAGRAAIQPVVSKDRLPLIGGVIGRDKIRQQSRVGDE